MLRHRTVLIITMTALALVAAACGPSAEKLTRSGNEAYAEQAYEEALAAYQEAQIESPELAEAYYNAANTLYRQGKYEEALAELDRALALIDDQPLAQNSYFNLGNSAFNIQGWEAAVEAYKEALLRNPDDQDAKVNLELALQQMQEQQQDQQDQQEQNQDGQDEQDQDQSEDTQEQNSSEDQQDQDSQEQSQENQEPDSAQSEQEQRQDESNDSSQQGQNPHPGDPQQDQGDPQVPQPGQPQPGSEQLDDQQRPGMALAPGQRMTEDQARQLLAAIAQNGETLQERLGQYLMVRGRPPVQDW